MHSARYFYLLYNFLFVCIFHLPFVFSSLPADSYGRDQEMNSVNEIQTSGHAEEKNSFSGSDQPVRITDLEAFFGSFTGQQRRQKRRKEEFGAEGRGGDEIVELASSLILLAIIIDLTAYLSESNVIFCPY